MLSTSTAAIAPATIRAASAGSNIAVLGVVAVRVAGFVLLGDEPAG
jgi:hypothetical protein